MTEDSVVESLDMSEKPSQSASESQQRQEEQKPSKSALKKAAREQGKAERRAAVAARLAAEQQARNANEVDTAAGLYGQLPVNRSQERARRVFLRLETLDDADISNISSLSLNDSSASREDENNPENKVWLRARVHNSRAQGSKICFLNLRQQTHTIQAVLSADKVISKQMVKFAVSIPFESIVIVHGALERAPAPVKSATVSNFELKVHELWLASRAPQQLAFQLDDASRSEVEIAAAEAKIAAESESNENDRTREKQAVIRVGLDTRLNNRVLDLRTATNQAIFDIQHGMTALFREFLMKERFVEAHSPKIIGTSSEGGANVFKVQYYNRDAYLGQSPQLYKQMLIAADRERVFEIAPVFRAEDSNTYRHLSEFTGVDLEMALDEHYHEAMELIWRMFRFIFHRLEKDYARQIACVRKQFPSEPFLLPSSDKPVKFTFNEAIALLQEEGWRRQLAENNNTTDVNNEADDPDDMDKYKQDVDFDDFSTREERKLGQIVRKKFGTDFYIVDKFPSAIRPFYTMCDPENPKYSNSYDFFMRGEEILSGAQRVHEPELLIERIKSLGLPIDGLEDYIDTFRLGAPPHAGGGIGLERVLMYYLALPNIRLASAFPRDPKRLSP